MKNPFVVAWNVIFGGEYGEEEFIVTLALAIVCSFILLYFILILPVLYIWQLDFHPVIKGSLILGYTYIEYKGISCFDKDETKGIKRRKHTKKLYNG